MNDGATDEDPEAKKKEDDDEDKNGKGKKPPAMDQNTVKQMIDDAVTSTKEAVLKTQREISEAREHVRPVVGQIAMDAACAADVFRAALKSIGVQDVEKLHDTALQPVFDATSAAKPKAQQTTLIAQDSAGAADFVKRFPGTANIRIAG